MPYARGEDSVPPSDRAKNEVRAAATPAAPPPLLRISGLSIGYVSTDLIPRWLWLAAGPAFTLWLWPRGARIHDA